MAAYTRHCVVASQSVGRGYQVCNGNHGCLENEVSRARESNALNQTVIQGELVHVCPTAIRISATYADAKDPYATAPSDTTVVPPATSVKR